MNRHALAIDIGGTKMSAAWVDQDGTVSSHRVVATPKAVPWQALLELTTALLAQSPGKVTGVGIGTAGPLDHQLGTVSPVNIPAWHDFPLLNQIQSILPGTRISLAGDGIRAAIGEHWLGAGRGSRHMLGVVVSTGVGGGLVLDGKVHLGRTGNAGHIGHLIVDLDGESCPCGSIGCVETLASGPSLVRWARSRGWRSPKASSAARPASPREPASQHDRASARELAEAAAQGDPVAVAAFDRAARALAAGFVSTAAVCDLDLVIVGGGVAAAGPVLFEPLQRWVKRLAKLTFVEPLTVVGAALQQHAGLLGAAALIHRPEAYDAEQPLRHGSVRA